MGTFIQEQFNELSFYTLAHKDPSFIHQHIVDAQTAQTADMNSKPIGLIFSLIGLYLFVEKGFSGKRIQEIHMKISNEKKEWPAISLPVSRGDITVTAILAAAPGPERDKMISNWCVSVWNAYQESHQVIIDIIPEKFLYQ